MITRNLPVLIPIIYLASALLLPLFGLWKKRTAYWIAFLAILADASVACWGLLQVITNGTIHYRLGDWAPPIGIEYILDPLSAFMAAVIGIIALMVIIFAKRSVASELPDKQVPYYAMVLLLLAGFSGIVVTGDLFNLYVFLEISSLAAYALVAVGERGAPVAAFRYLIMGTVGASFYLLGLWFIYMLTGSLNMADVASIIPTLFSNPALALALAMMIAGMGIKMALFPLHGWPPDAYTLAPSASSALIAPVGTKVGAYVLIRVMLYI
ncbi:MAG TPA: proton-conducting transporter membrane subunit, partial [Pseudodesulfovibrio sp.]|nr:proton-conducting transporter membrane subunit [Pseudodesulfovibrio sp.]